MAERKAVFRFVADFAGWEKAAKHRKELEALRAEAEKTSASYSAGMKDMTDSNKEFGKSVTENKAKVQEQTSFLDKSKNALASAASAADAHTRAVDDNTRVVVDNTRTLEVNRDTTTEVGREHGALRRSVDGAGRGIGNMITRLGAFGDRLRSVGEEARDVGFYLRLMAVPALISLLGNLVSMIMALGAGLTSLIGPLSQVVSLLGVLPAGLMAIVGVAGTMFAAFKGMGAALQAMNKAAEEQNSTTARAMKERADAAEAVVDAQRGLSDALWSEKKAEEAVTEARRRARYALQDLRMEADRNAISQQRAQLSLVEAQRRVQEIQMGLTSATDLDYANALLDVQSAQLDVADAQKQSSRTAIELQEAEKKGVNGANAVIDAEHALANAINAVSDARRALTEANQIAAAGSNSIFSANQKVAEALANFSPAGRRFVRLLFGMRESILDLRKTAQTATLPGLGDAVKSLSRVFPQLTEIIKAAGPVIADSLKSIADGRWVDQLSASIIPNLPVISDLGDTLRNVLDILSDLAIAGAPAMRWMSDAMKRWTGIASEATKTGIQTGRLQAFFARAVEQAQRLGHIFANLFKIIYYVATAGSDLGNTLLQSWSDTTDRWVVKVRESQDRMHAYFMGLRDLLAELGHLFKAFGDWFIQLGGDSEGVTAGIVQRLREEVLPILKELVRTASGNFGNALVDFLKVALSIFTVFTKSSGQLSAFLGTLTLIAGAFNAVLQIPFVTRMASIIFVIQGVKQAFQLAYKVGLAPFIKTLSYLKTLWTTTSAAMAATDIAAGAPKFAAIREAMEAYSAALRKNRSVTQAAEAAQKSMTKSIAAATAAKAATAEATAAGTAADAANTASTTANAAATDVNTGSKAANAATTEVLAGATEELAVADVVATTATTTQAGATGFLATVQGLAATATGVLAGALRGLVSSLGPAIVLLAALWVAWQAAKAVWNWFKNQKSPEERLAEQRQKGLDALRKTIREGGDVQRELDRQVAAYARAYEEQQRRVDAASIAPTTGAYRPEATGTGETYAVGAYATSGQTAAAQAAAAGASVGMTPAEYRAELEKRPDISTYLELPGVFRENAAAATFFADQAGKSLADFRYDLEKTLGDTGEGAKHARVVVFQEMIAQVDEFRKSIEENFTSASEVLDQFSGDAKVSLDDVQKSIDDQIKLYDEYDRLLAQVREKAAKEGIDITGLEKTLAEGGLEQIGLLRALAGGSGKDLAKLSDGMDRIDSAAETIADTFMETMLPALEEFINAMREIYDYPPIDLKARLDAREAVVAANNLYESLEAAGLHPIANKIKSMGGPGAFVPQFHSGGVVGDPSDWASGSRGGDEVDTRLKRGEFVVNQGATRENRSLLEMINSGRRKFHLGGFVDTLKAAASMTGDYETTVRPQVDPLPPRDLYPGRSGGRNGATPSATAAYDWVRAAFPSLRGNLGVGHTWIGSTGVRSQHSYGNALDIFGPAVDMARLFVTSVLQAGLIHLRTAIFDRMVWQNSADGAKAVAGPYSVPPGGSTHEDHVHLDFWPPGGRSSGTGSGSSGDGSRQAASSGIWKMPLTAMGGVVTSRQARIVGESGPEAIIPLPRFFEGLRRGFVPQLPPTASPVAQAAIAGAQKIELTLEVDGSVLTKTVELHGRKARLLLGDRRD